MLAAPPETAPSSGAGTSRGAASLTLGSTGELGGLLLQAGSRGTPCPSTQTFGSYGILGSDPGEDIVASGLRIIEGWRGGNRRENELATLERLTLKAHLSPGAHWPCEQLYRGDPLQVTGFWNWEEQTDPARRWGEEEPEELFGSSLRPTTTPPPDAVAWPGHLGKGCARLSSSVLGTQPPARRTRARLLRGAQV